MSNKKLKEKSKKEKVKGKEDEIVMVQLEVAQAVERESQLLHELKMIEEDEE